MLTLILLIPSTPLRAQQARSKVIPINAKFRDVSTDDLSGDARAAARRPVSYTHLTLPTIYSV